MAHCRFALLLWLFLVIGYLLCGANAANVYNRAERGAADKSAMVWLCLERCGDNRTEIDRQLRTIELVAPRALTAVSFELYNLGSGSSLVKQLDLDQRINDVLKPMRGVHGKPLLRLPMISSYPYPVELITWMRTLFKNPKPFISECLDEAIKNDFHGYNLDLEPVKEVTTEDAAAYADFIGRFGAALHEYGLVLTVDTASWSPLWNYTLISRNLDASRGDRMITMATYTVGWDTWQSVFQQALRETANYEQLLGIGLMPVDGHDAPISKDAIDARFDAIQKARIHEVDIWRMATSWMGPDSYWWTVLEKFVKS